MKLIKNISLAVVLFLGASVNAMSEQSPAFKEAAASWLENNEEESLTALSTLAKSGDIHAQIMLGQIDRDTVPGGASDFILGLNRQERHDLLRNPKQTGKTANWLLSLSDDSLAGYGKTMFEYRLGLDPVSSMTALEENGETAAAQFLVWHTMDQGRFDLANEIPPSASGLVETGTMNWLRTFMANENKLMNSTLFLNDTSKDKVPGLLSLDKLSWVLGLRDSISVEIHDLILVIRGQPGRVSEDANPLLLNSNLKEVAKVDPALGLLNRVCSVCPEAEADTYCLSQSLEMLGGYRTLASLRSPAEKVISMDEFYASERSVSTLQNVLKNRSGGYDQEIRSTCLKSLISN